MILFFAAIASLYADTVSYWVAKGCPSPDREWQAKDYTAFHNVLAKGILPLPKLDSEPGRSILRHLVDTQNLSFHRNRNLSIDIRMPDLLDVSQETKKIMLLYFRAAERGEKVEEELAELLVFQLAATAAVIEVVEEFVPTIPRDEMYETRMEGLARMKQGMATVLDGALTSLSERTHYSNGSVARIARGIREYYPQFNRMLSEPTRVEFRRRIDELLAKEKNPGVKEELGLLANAMKGASSGAGKASSLQTNSAPPSVCPGR